MEPNQNNPDGNANARREALKKMAVFGAYTAPVMLGMLTATKATAASGGGFTGGGSNGGCGVSGRSCSFD